MSIEKTSKPVGRARVILSQVLACLALDFLLIGLGMSVSFVTMVLPEVLDATEGVSINKSQASWFGSMAFLCQPLGSVFSGPLLDYFGRKKALFLVNIPHLMAWLLMYSAWNVPSLFVANALLGIGTGIMEAPSVTYVGEVSDPSIRGILTTLTNGFTSTGIFVAYLLGTVLPWRQAALVSLTVPLVTMAMVLFVPETPIWLISKGRQKEALRSLCRLRGWASPEQVREEFDQLINYNETIHQCIICVKKGLESCTHENPEPRKRENGNSEPRKHENGNQELRKYEYGNSEPRKIENGNSKTYSYEKRPLEPYSHERIMQPCRHEKRNFFKRFVWKLKNIFFVKETMRPFLLVMTYFLFHTMSGLSPVRPNMVNLCKALGMKYDSKTIVVVVGAVHIIMSLISATIVRFTGKRKLILTSLLASGVFSLSISVYASTSLPANVFSYESHTFPDKKDILPVFLFLGLVCFYALGIPWVLLSEVFPFRSRGMATGLAAALSYTIFFIASKTNYNMESYLHLSGTYAIYASFAFLGTVYLYFTLPETEKKTLVEIETYYKGNQKIFADDCFINYFRKKSNNDVSKPMLVSRDDV